MDRIGWIGEMIIYIFLKKSFLSNDLLLYDNTTCISVYVYV